MSKRKVTTVCLVVDASIARAAGPVDAVHPLSRYCRLFLYSMRGVGHRVAWNDLIRAEWDLHQSKFAREWLVSMRRTGKVRTVTTDVLEPFREAIASHFGDDRVAEQEIVLKDAHLIEAAIRVDRIVASLDEAARFHFGKLSASFEPLCEIAWVNPGNETEQTHEWLEDGAPHEKNRCLASITE